jgi:hypothetical protein
MAKIVQGGFNKWSIGIDEENGCVLVSADYFPNFVSLQLHDAFAKDLRKIGEMFLETATLWEAQHKASEILQKRQKEAAQQSSG